MKKEDSDFDFQKASEAPNALKVTLKTNVSLSICLRMLEQVY